MPLVYAGRTGVDQPVTEAHARARKVKKQYLDGPLVPVASARHQAEAELIQGMLLEQGVPSLVRRSGGFDVPDMMFAGPRDILVPEAGAEVARETLGLPAPQTPSSGPAPPRPRAPAGPGTRTLALVLACVLAVAALGPLAVWFWSQIHG
jgi:hypothetical protein